MLPNHPISASLSSSSFRAVYYSCYGNIRRRYTLLRQLLQVTLGDEESWFYSLFFGSSTDDITLGIIISFVCIEYIFCCSSLANSISEVYESFDPRRAGNGWYALFHCMHRQWNGCSFVEMIALQWLLLTRLIRSKCNQVSTVRCEAVVSDWMSASWRRSLLATQNA